MAPRLSLAQVALPASALLIFFGLWARDASNGASGGAAGGSAFSVAAPAPPTVVSLAAEERAVILDRIKQEVGAAQQQNEQAFSMLSSRLEALESAGARGVRSSNSNGNNANSKPRSAAVGAPDDAYKLKTCGPGWSVTVPPGKSARTRSEVMEKSKLDPQYGMGIVHKEKPDNLVNSKDYWETRYAMGGNSGAGSYNKIATFKAKIMNEFVAKNDINHVLELGFGDGAQLTKAKYPKYTGLDVSETIWKKTSAKFKDDPTKQFKLYDGNKIPGLTADCTLTFDVIYHLVEDKVFHSYMKALFDMSTKYVVVYASNIAGWHGAAHVLHRDVTGYVEKTFPRWKLIGTLQNDYAARSAQDFFFYAKC